MKASPARLHPLVSPEELQGLLAPVPARERLAHARPHLAWVLLLAVFKVGLFLALTRLPLTPAALHGMVDQYVTLRLAFDAMVMALLAVSVQVALLRNRVTVLWSVTLTTLGMDLLAWLAFSA
ncbi:MAG: hypothetical protein ACKODU_02660 [Limnohabitans sp.]